MADTVQTEDKSEQEVESRIYEVGYLLVPTISEEEVAPEVTAVKDILEKEKAHTIAEEFPKFRPLAYAMRKRVGGAYETFTNGYFGWVKFETSPEAVKRIEEALKKLPRILRCLVIKTIREHIPHRAKEASFRKEHREAPKDSAPSVPISETELEKSLEKIITE